ncbi:MAG: RNA 2',3'-cyclic phosphodiesterase [Elusimicrobiota bacterium]|jgi:2'-5' RNA ligase
MLRVRLFIAVPVSEMVRSSAFRIMRELRGLGVEGKWTEPGNLHLTLRFLGSTSEDDIPGLEALMLRAAQRPDFDIEFQGLGVFDSWDSPRVLWVGVGRGAGELKALAEALGPDPGGRPFSAHLTLGRMRVTRDSGILERAAQSLEFAAIAQRVGGLVLYESRPGPGGSVYVARKPQPFWR